MRFYSQHYNGASQVNTLLDFLSLEEPTHAVLTSAYATRAGISSLEKSLSKMGGILDLYVGIRNAITSQQMLETALDYGINLYTVDTGTPKLTFHEKTGYIANSTTARMMITSANLTKQALFSNIETGCTHDIDVGSTEQVNMEQAFCGHMEWLRDKFPRNVVRVTSLDDIAELVERGVVADETKKYANRATTKGTKILRDKDDTPKMVFDKITPRGIKYTGPKGELYWRSSPLTHNKLSIPSGPNTHAEGPMPLTQGRFKVDQRHYFRDVVFADFEWVKDTREGRGHYERAEIDAKFVIKGVDYGTRKLTVGHNTDTTCRRYQQSNSMTQIHWGESLPLIANEDLLGRTLNIYKTDDAFIMDIS